MTNSKKRTTTSEVILGASAKALANGVQALREATEKLTDMATKAEELETKIAEKEAKISEIDVQYTEKARQAQVNLELETKRNADEFVRTHVERNQQQVVSKSEYAALNGELNKLRSAEQSEINTKVNAAKKEYETEYANKTKTLELEYQAKEANNKAALAQKDAQIEFLTKTCDSWQKALDAEREASIKRAAGQAAPVVNVSGTK